MYLASRYIIIIIIIIIIKVMRQGPKGLTQKAYSLFKGDFLCPKESFDKK